MMNNTNLATFNFNNTPIRIIEIEGNPWFVAKDVCHVLGLRMNGGVHRYTRPLLTDEKGRIKIPTLGGPQNMIMVSESGLYKIIMRAHRSNPIAADFQDWVTRVVLPAIRKDGMYVMGEEKVITGEMSEDELVFKAMTLLQEKVERLKAEVEEMHEELNVLTVDEFRSLNHRYLTHGQKTKLGQQANQIRLMWGRPKYPSQEREIISYGSPRTVYVNVYDRDVLARAAQVIGLSDMA